MSADSNSRDEVAGLSYSELTDIDQLFRNASSYPQIFISSVLLTAVVADSNVPPNHESDIFRFRSWNGQEFCIVADRVAHTENATTTPLNDNHTDLHELVPSPSEAIALTPRGDTIVSHPTPATTTPAPRHSRPIISLSSSRSATQYLSGVGVDKVRAWQPTHSELWWKGAHASSHNGAANKCGEFGFDGSGLTFLDVVVALYAVHQCDPAYSLLAHNCWWYARCVLLVLWRRNRSITEDQDDVAFFHEAKAPAVLIPGSLSESMIRADVDAALAIFDDLVSSKSIM